jgi:hypothetical protein
MPPSKENVEQEQPFLDNSHVETSVDTSAAASPIESRSYSSARLHGSFLLPSSSDLTASLPDLRPQDERTPLLSSRRSRIRIAEGTIPKPRLSRHQSTTGMRPVSSRCPVLLSGVMLTLSQTREFTKHTTP